MKRVYIAHPLRGPKPYSDYTLQDNLMDLDSICRSNAEDFPDMLFISPVHLFRYLDPYDTPDNQMTEYFRELILLCDEMWVYGDYSTSEGCKAEIEMFSHIHPDGRIWYCEAN